MRERSACAPSATPRRSTWAIAVSVGLFTWCFAVPAATARADNDVRVSGRVLDPDGKPLAGAELYLGYHGPEEMKYPLRSTSGEDGRFAFSFPKADLDATDFVDPAFQVLAVAEGHGCVWVTADAGVRELTLRLVKDAPIKGRILDADGKPVAGAKLTLTGVGDDGAFMWWANRTSHYVKRGTTFNTGRELYTSAKGWRGPLPGQPAVLTTDAGGRFEVAGAGGGRTVGLHLEGAGIATADLAVQGASFEHQAAVSRPIRGVVRDKDTGKPLPGTTVFFLPWFDDWYEPSRWLKVVTDKDGRYELRGLAKTAQYTLRAKPAEGQLYFQREVGVQDTPGLEALTHDIEMVRGLTVRGKVTDKATGRPVARAMVDYHPLLPNPNVNKKLPGVWFPRSEATTGPDGSYALTVLPGPGVIGVAGPKPDSYMPSWVAPKELKEFFKTPIIVREDALTTDCGGSTISGLQDAYNAQFLLEPGEKEDALVKDVELERAIELKGQMVGPDGKPLAGVTVFGLASRWWHLPETLKGAEFTVRRLNPRAPRQLLFHHKEKDLGFFLRELPAEKNGPLTIQLQACGSLAGRLLGPDGKPVPGEKLPLWTRDHMWFGGQEVTTDKEGRFRATGLVPGLEYRVMRPGGMVPHFVEVVVEPGKKKDVGDLKLDN